MKKPGVIPEPPPPPPKLTSHHPFIIVLNPDFVLPSNAPVKPSLILTIEEEMELREKDVTELSDEELYYIVNDIWLPDCYGYLTGDNNYHSEFQTIRAEYPALQKFVRQFRETEGFDLDEIPDLTIMEKYVHKKPVCPTTHPDEYAKYMNLADYAIKDYNDKLKTEYAVSEVKSVNITYHSAEADYYITFIVTANGGVCETFQAQIWSGRGMLGVKCCRPKPTASASPGYNHSMY